MNQDQLVGNSLNNGHVVEVKLNADGTLNERELETFCGEALKGRVVWDGHIYRNNLEGRRALRNEMARLQNISEEF